MGSYYLEVLKHKEFSTASLTPSLKLKKQYQYLTDEVAKRFH